MLRYVHVHIHRFRMQAYRLGQVARGSHSHLEHLNLVAWVCRALNEDCMMWAIQGNIISFQIHVDVHVRYLVLYLDIGRLAIIEAL